MKEIVEGSYGSQDFPSISLTYVVPVYNEEVNIVPVVDAVVQAFALFEEINGTYEIIFVDDGSTDRTVDIISEQHAINSRVKCISLGRNYGHQAAVTAGLAASSGEMTAIIDGDLQDPPIVINTFARYIRSGYDLVYGVRTKRKEHIIKRAAYKSFYRLMAALGNIDIPLDSGDFCLMNRRFLETLNSLPEKNRFIRGLRSYIGFKQVGVKYERDARFKGSPKYTLSKLIKLATDGIINFSDRPMALMSTFGVALSILSVSISILLFIQRVFSIEVMGISSADIPGYASLGIFLTLLMGMQFLCIGILGQYIARIFVETKSRPVYTVQSSIGF